MNINNIVSINRNHEKEAVSDETMETAMTPCPTCSPPRRETVGMVCQTCGTDYGTPEPDLETAERIDAARKVIGRLAGDYRESTAREALAAAGLIYDRETVAKAMRDGRAAIADLTAAGLLTNDGKLRWWASRTTTRGKP